MANRKSFLFNVKLKLPITQIEIKIYGVFFRSAHKVFSTKDFKIIKRNKS